MFGCAGPTRCMSKNCLMPPADAATVPALGAGEPASVDAQVQGRRTLGILPARQRSRTIMRVRISSPALWAMFLLAAVAVSSPARADMYAVNRVFTEGPNTASLTGTLTLPQGNYTIIDRGAAPFTAVDLVLTVNGATRPSRW